MTNEQFFQEQFLAKVYEDFGNYHIEQRFPGFRGILSYLAQAGGFATVSKTQDGSLENHLFQFSYFTISDAKNYNDCICIAFDRDAYLQSPEFQEFIGKTEESLFELIREYESMIDMSYSRLKSIASIKKNPTSIFK